MVSSSARRRAFIRARRFALLEHGYPENWSPKNGERCLFVNVCSRTGLLVVVEGSIYFECDQPDIKAIINTIDVKCPYCGKIHALRALPDDRVVQTFLKKFNYGEK